MMELFKNIIGIQDNGLLRFLIILFVPYYILMDSILYVSISQSSLPFLTPQQIEKTLNNFFGETVVEGPLTKKEKKKIYEAYRSRSLKNKKKSIKLRPMPNFQIIKRKILKYGEVWSKPIKKIGNLATKCFAYYTALYPTLY